MPATKTPALQIINDYDYRAMLTHQQKHSDAISVAHKYRLNNFQKYAAIQANENHLIFEDADFMKQRSQFNRLNDEHAAKIPHGALNIGLQIPDGIFAWDATDVKFPANIFPAGALRHNGNHWHLLDLLPTEEIIEFRNSFFTINQPINTNNTPNIDINSYAAFMGDAINNMTVPEFKYYESRKLSFNQNGLGKSNIYNFVIAKHEKSNTAAVGRSIESATILLLNEFFKKQNTK